MKEFVTANGATYECKNAETGINGITLAITGQSAADMKAVFSGVSEISLSYGKYEEDEEGNQKLVLEKPHGIYKNLKLAYAGEDVEDGSAIVTMRIKSEIEIRLDRLEEVQEIQNGAIDELVAMQGGEK